jgi:hypothetical protein
MTNESFYKLRKMRTEEEKAEFFKKLLEQELNQEIVDVITGERLGKAKDVWGIG